MKQGWKVLRIQSRRSIIMGAYNDGKKYPVREWVRPNLNCGPLALFRDRDTALLWAERMRSFVVACHYKRSFRRSVWCVSMERKVLRRLPRGTVLARAICCLE